MSVSIWFWVAFHLGVFAALAVDLFSFHGPHKMTLRSAIKRSVVWIFLSLGFNALVWFWQGSSHAIDFFTGYLIEYSLSVDNIFVFVLIFAYFRVPPEYEHRVLIWGIVGALVMRASMIWLGVALVARFHFVLDLLGGFLIVTGLRMMFAEPAPLDLEKNFILRFVRRLVPVTKEYRGSHFHARVNGRFLLTPLALVVIVIDVIDLAFAVDSIPAVLAITQNTFIIYTSNVCAILGLRSLYFLLAHLVSRFIFLRAGLALILCFVGGKMIGAHWLALPNWISLLVIVSILAITISISVFVTRDRARLRAR